MTRFLVTGAGGQLGQEFVALLEGSRHEVIAASKDDLDVSDRDQVFAAIKGLSPDVVIHSAAWTAVDMCESDPQRAFATNSFGTRNIAEASRQSHAHVVYISSDYVFDGAAGRPYVEWDLPNPISVYGRSKLGGELEMSPSDTIVRTSWVCGRHGANFVSTMLRLAASDAQVPVVDDQFGSPTFTADLAQMIWRLALDRRGGIWHVTNQGETSWFGFARAVFEAAGADPDRVRPIPTSELSPARPAPRPIRSTLANTALQAAGERLAPAWEESLAKLVAELAG